MKKNIKFLTLSLFGIIPLIGVCVHSAISNKFEKVYGDSEYVNFCYNVCYEGGSNRVDRLLKGEKAINWNAKRRNFILKGWFEDRDYTIPFDFNSHVNVDTMIYAKWELGSSSNQISVTFNFNYDNCPQPETFNIYAGEKVAVDKVPSPSRFGYIPTGWYTDPNDKSTKWSFLNDTFTTDTVLYAGYSYDDSLVLDENGDVVFDNVEIDFAPNILSWGGGGSEVDYIVQRFNNAFSSKIHVNVVPFNTTETVTFEDTSFINEVKDDYYNIGEVLSTIKDDFVEEDYYEDAISENYISGTLKTLPVVHLVPFMIYNKSLLKQMGLEAFPTDHNGIYETLVAANTKFGSLQSWKGALSQSDYNWANFEIGHHTMWSNSNFRFFDYDKDTNTYINNFKLESNKEVLYNAFVGANRIFGYNSLINSGYDDNFTSNFVNGNSLACYFGFSTQFQSIRNNIGLNDKAFVQKYGFIPVNDLCNYGEYENSHVFAKGLSMGLRKSNSDLTQVAAGAVFAKWFSENSAPLMSKYAYPANKTVQTGDEFNAGDFESYVLQKAVDPSRIYTLPGHKLNYKMFNYFNQNCLASILPPSYISLESSEVIIRTFGNAFNAYLEED